MRPIWRAHHAEASPAAPSGDVSTGITNRASRFLGLIKALATDGSAPASIPELGKQPPEIDRGTAPNEPEVLTLSDLVVERVLGA